jgi:hypothetical protein
MLAASTSKKDWTLSMKNSAEWAKKAKRYFKSEAKWSFTALAQEQQMRDGPSANRTQRNTI